jgi:hypothetical protein
MHDFLMARRLSFHRASKRSSKLIRGLSQANVVLGKELHSRTQLGSMLFARTYSVLFSKSGSEGKNPSK